MLQTHVAYCTQTMLPTRKKSSTFDMTTMLSKEFCFSSSSHRTTAKKYWQHVSRYHDANKALQNTVGNIQTVITYSFNGQVVNPVRPQVNVDGKIKFSAVNEI